MSSVNDWLHLSVVVIGIAVVIYKLVDLIRSPRRPALWALWSAFLTLSLAIIAGNRWSPKGPGEVQAIWITQHILIFIAFAGLEGFFFLSVAPRPALAWRAFAPHALALVVATVVMSVAFVASLASENPDFMALDRYYGPWLTTMLLAYIAGFAAAMLAISSQAIRWARITDKRWMRRGLRSLAIGCGISLVYTLHKAVFTLLIAASSPLPWNQLRVEIVLASAGITCALVGLILPAIGPRLSSARQWLRHWGSYRHLKPLWRELAHPKHGVARGVALIERPPWWDPEFSLQRRVIEIWDARRRISPYLDRDLGARVLHLAREHNTPDTDIPALVEAHCLRDAIQRKRIQGPKPNVGGIEAPRTGNNLASAVRFLEQVAAAFANPALPFSTNQDTHKP